GMELQATMLKLARFQAVFEVYNPACILRTSEVLTDFRIVLGDQPIYSGRAIVSNLIHTGTLVVCEVKLEDSWQDVNQILPQLNGDALRAGFGQFLQQWHKVYAIRPEYKTVVADMQAFLSDLRLWLDQVELAIRSTPNGDRAALEHDLAGE